MMQLQIHMLIKQNHLIGIICNKIKLWQKIIFTAREILNELMR
jgi:hypothetical protein